MPERMAFDSKDTSIFHTGEITWRLSKVEEMHYHDSDDLKRLADFNQLAAEFPISSSSTRPSVGPKASFPGNIPN
jgi:hypothetical protein